MTHWGSRHTKLRSIRTPLQRTLSFAVLLSLGGGASSCDRNPRVTTLGDAGEGSLRAAFSAANAATGTDPITIELAPGTYTLSLCADDEEDSNETGDLDLTTDVPVTLRATGAGVVIQQTCSNRVIDALGTGSLTLAGITIAGGNIRGRTDSFPVDPGGPTQGGGIRTRGDLKLLDSVITANVATGNHARYGEVSRHAEPAFGGGLFVGGSLDAERSTISSNRAEGGSATYVLSPGADAEGGGAYVVGAVTLRDVVFSENVALGGQGYDGEPSFMPAGGDARGGALAQAPDSTGAVRIRSCRMASNTAQGGYGALQSVTPDGRLPAAGSAIGGALALSGAAEMTDLTATYNRAVAGTMDVGVFPADAAAYDSPGGLARGGVLALSARSIIDASTFTANEATSGYGLLLCRAPGNCVPWSAAPALGGAIWIGAELTLTRSSFSENKAEQRQEDPLSEGMARGGAVAGSAGVTLEDDRFLFNRAVLGRGGALSAGIVSLVNVEFQGNVADGRGGAIDVERFSASGVRATGNRAGGSGGGALWAGGESSLAGSTIHDNHVVSRAVEQSPAGGGGVFVAGHLSLVDTAITANSGEVTLNLPDICLGCLGVFQGAGVRAESVDGDSVTVANNRLAGYTILPNTLLSARVPAGISGGAGIAVTGQVTLLNGTLSGNTLVQLGEPWIAGLERARGAAVLAGTLELNHATVVDNLGGATFSVSTLIARRSVALPAAEQALCAAPPHVPASLYDWFGDATCALSDATDHQGPGPLVIAPLADNGGPVPTRVPAAGSALIDAIPAPSCPRTRDARGVARPQGAGCEIGAVEVTP